MKFSIGTLVNDEVLLRRYLLSSKLPVNTKIDFVKNAPSAYVGLNILLEKFHRDKSDVGIFVHQDITVSDKWLPQVENQLKKLPENWLLAGVWGRTSDETYHGKILDIRSPAVCDSDDALPMEVECLDEACILFNLKYSIRLDEDFLGFDLYGTYLPLLGGSMGLKSYVINALLIHNCTRSFSWTPDSVFLSNWELLKKKFPNRKIISTVYEE